MVAASMVAAAMAAAAIADTAPLPRQLTHVGMAAVSTGPLLQASRDRIVELGFGSRGSGKQAKIGEGGTSRQAG